MMMIKPIRRPTAIASGAMLGCGGLARCGGGALTPTGWVRCGRGSGVECGLRSPDAEFRAAHAGIVPSSVRTGAPRI